MIKLQAPQTSKQVAKIFNKNTFSLQMQGHCSCCFTFYPARFYL